MFIPDKRRKILEVFFGNPFDEIHMREAMRLSKVSLTNVDDSLQLFVKDGLFKRRDVSNMSFFKPDLWNERLLKVFEYLELERKREFNYKNKNIARLLWKYTRNAVELSNHEIQCMLLFGSVARGEWEKGSDIDVLAVVARKHNNIAKALNEAKIDVSPLLEIRPIVTTIAKLTEGLRARNEFHDELWRDRVVLYNEFLFWRMIAERGT